MNLANQMIRAGEAYAAYPATAQGTTILHSYAEVANRVSRIAAALVGRYGLKAGERVALIPRSRLHQAIQPTAHRIRLRYSRGDSTK